MKANANLKAHAAEIPPFGLALFKSVEENGSEQVSRSNSTRSGVGGRMCRKAIPLAASKDVQ